MNKLDTFCKYCKASVWITVISCFIVLAVTFSSCATKKKVVETETTKTEVKTDSSSVQSVKTDSTSTEHKKDSKETEKIEKETKVEKSDSTVLTVDSQGNVIKQETWHKEKETVSSNREYEKLLLDSIKMYKESHDSLMQYMSKCDSLSEKLSHKEYITVEKTKIPKWCYVCLAFTIIILIFAIYKIKKWVQTTWGRT